MPAPNETKRDVEPRAVLELSTGDPVSAVRHVAACLARRAHSLLGLLCLRGADGTGRLLVAVADDGRLERLVSELAALPEVAGARLGDAGADALAAVFAGEALAA